MLLGIGLAFPLVLHRVFICPSDANCPSSIDPSNRVFQDTRTVLQYWLEFGMILFTYGFTRLLGYHAWLSMNRQGDTIRKLDQSIKAISGSPSNAARLLAPGGRSKALGIFMLLEIGLVFCIPFVVGFSISNLQNAGTVGAQFTYSSNLTIPDISNPADFTTVSGFVVNGIEERLLKNWESGGNDSLSGTFVLQDNRIVYAVNAQPTGQRIDGTLSCFNPTPNISIVDDDVTYWPSVPSVNTTVSAPLPQTLRAALLDFPSYGVRLLWASTEKDAIPNATEVTTSAGGVYVAVCNHQVFLSDISNAGAVAGAQDLQPTSLFVASASSVCDMECVTSRTTLFLATWWNLLFNRTIITAGGQSIFCDGGALSTIGTAGGGCTLTDGVWSTTLRIVLDAWFDEAVQKGSQIANQTQTLQVRAQTINKNQWWLQAVIPACALLIYVACLAYILIVDQPQEDVRRLGTFEVVVAAHMDMYGLDHQGRLTPSMNVGGTGLSEIKSSDKY